MKWIMKCLCRVAGLASLVCSSIFGIGHRDWLHAIWWGIMSIIMILLSWDTDRSE